MEHKKPVQKVMSKSTRGKDPMTKPGSVREPQSQDSEGW